MDMQGTPVGGSNASTKVTSGGQAQKPISEGAGPVASDSLAAESAKADGLFSENRDSDPQSVSGSNSTFANTDTSGATTLPPARDAPSRDAVWNESGAGEKYPEGAGGQGRFAGSHAGGTYSGGSSTAKRDLKSDTQGEGYDTSGSGGAFSNSGAGGPSSEKISSGSLEGKQQSSLSSGGTQSSSHGSGGNQQAVSESSSGSINRGSNDVDTAPNYVTSVTQPFNQGQPKGTAVEGSSEDFQGDSNQAAPIGSREDPGLRAEQKYQQSSSTTSGGSGPRQGQISSDSPYDNLSGDQQA